MHEEHWALLRETFVLAEQALKAGDAPYGALLAVGGTVLLHARNTVSTQHDITAHAEMNLIREAWQTLSSETLSQATLYASAEPCSMCAGAIYWSGISKVVFGCGVELNAKITAQDIVVKASEVLLRGGRHIELIGPLLEDEAALAIRRSCGVTSSDK